MAAASTDARTDLDRVRERRNALRLTLDALESANAAPANERWHDRMRDTLQHAADMLSEHVAETEGPDGFFQELVHHEPRVGQNVQALRDEHGEMQRQLAALIDRCENRTCLPDEVRDDVEDLMGLLHRHRRAGADLLYEAYKVDIAFGD